MYASDAMNPIKLATTATFIGKSTCEPAIVITMVVTTDTVTKFDEKFVCKAAQMMKTNTINNGDKPTNSGVKNDSIKVITPISGFDKKLSKVNFAAKISNLGMYNHI